MVTNSFYWPYTACNIFATGNLFGIILINKAFAENERLPNRSRASRLLLA